MRVLLPVEFSGYDPLVDTYDGWVRELDGLVVELEQDAVASQYRIWIQGSDADLPAGMYLLVRLEDELVTR